MDKIAKIYVNMLLEMAQPTESMRKKTLYHGTQSLKSALSIARNGIVPGNTDPTKKGLLTPVKNKVYLTPDLSYAQIYGIGGDMAGVQSKRHEEEKIKHGNHFYIFSKSEHDLEDIQPDEDSVGSLYHNHLNYTDKKLPPHLANHIMQNSTENQQKKVKDGEYAYFASMGKRVLKTMPDHMKNEIMNMSGVHIAHEGTVYPEHVYEVHRDDISKLKRDGSNFLEHSKKYSIEDFLKEKNER